MPTLKTATEIALAAGDRIAAAAERGKKGAAGPTITLAMIVKDEEKWLAETLASAKDHVDQIVVVDTGSKDKTKEIARSFGAEIHDFVWIDDFAAARNFAFSKATGDFVFWLDADDHFDPVAGKTLKEFAAGLAANVGGVMMEYFYAFDEAGNCVALHKKLRLVRNDNSFTWKGRIHEDLIPTGATDIRTTEDFRVLHRADETRIHASSERNVKVAEAEYQEKKHDPRAVFNLASTYMGLRRWNDAIKKYLEYVPMSGWDEEIYVAWCRVGQCLLELNQVDEAKNMYLRAVKVRPQYADAYRGLAHCSINEGKLDQAEEYYRMTLQKTKPESVIVWSPFDYEVAPYYELAQVLLNQNKVDEALEAVDRYIGLSNGKENGVQLRTIVLEAKKAMDFRAAYGAVATYLDGQDMDEELKNLLKAIPAEFRYDPVLTQIRSKRWARKESTGRDIAIWCGKAFEEWGPASLEKGVGGSEEAVIRLAREWSKLGWNVTVFNNCGTEDIVDVSAPETSNEKHGFVIYKPFWEYSPNDKFDVFISWRQPQTFDLKVNAPVKLLDLHDVPSLMDYPSKRLNEITKIMVKTQFHRQLLPTVKDEKIAVVGHGVDASEFPEGVAKVKNQIVYTSSYDRGLENLLAIWPKIRAEVPDATLKIAYGWGLFDVMRAGDKERIAWKEKMLGLMKQDGIEELGRLSHKDVARLMQESEVFAYPCDFEEIFAIAAAKAQLAGAIPVVGTSVGCLGETVKIGVHVTGDMKGETARARFADELIKILKDDDLKKKISAEARKAALKSFNWTDVAISWEKIFKGETK